MAPRVGAEVVLSEVMRLFAVAIHLDAPAAAHDLGRDAADHEVGTVFLGGGNKFLQVRRLDPGVGVHNEKIIASGVGEREVQRLLARAFRHMLDAHANVALGRHVEDARGTVDGAGVDHNDLDIAQGLVLDALHCPADRFLGVAGTHENRYGRRCGREVRQINTSCYLPGVRADPVF